MNLVFGIRFEDGVTNSIGTKATTQAEANRELTEHFDYDEDYFDEIFLITIGADGPEVAEHWTN